MRLLRYALTAVLIVILGVAIYQTAHWLGTGGNFTEPQVKPLDGADQEIALIEPATGADDWGRLVTALQLLELDWPKVNPKLPAVRVDLADAFPPLTSDVPEVVFTFASADSGKLRLRWYKISGEHDMASWVRKLRARPRQPLVVLGGGTSDRAVKLAYALRKTYGINPNQAAPVLALTTATSEKTTSGKSLINVYRGRTFRFSFTNQKMVDALFEFMMNRHYPAEDREWAQNLWAARQTEPQAPAEALASLIGAGSAWQSWAAIGRMSYLHPFTMFTVAWQDERYSQDMCDLFEAEFKERFPLGEFSPEGTIPYSLGGFFHAAPQEQAVVDAFFARRTPIKPHSFLVLPTGTVRMRRFLLNLRQRSPSDARNLVVLNGDAIAFTSVYRDRETLWNILDLPYSVVFFSHRNPVDHAAGFRWTRTTRASESVPQETTTGTQEVLLYRDVFEAIFYAASQEGRLLDDPDKVRARLQATVWQHPPGEPAKARVGNRLVHALPARPFFDAEGNRRSNTGEHVVWIKPSFTAERVSLMSKISVWAIHPEKNGAAWRLVEAVNATYNQSRLEVVP